MDREEIRQWADRLETASPREVLQWGWQQFGEEMALACSFGAEDVVLVDMLAKLASNPRIFYLDTDKHFPETYETRDRLSQTYNLSFIRVKPNMTLQEQAEKHGDRLWETDPDLCCRIRKVDPLRNVLKNYRAWVTGIRREQAPTRANARKVEWDDKFGLIKLNPLATWRTQDVWNYIRENQVPYHPLHDRDYPSIGCRVCTRPVSKGEDPRSGRWAGKTKLECGLHQ
ncbi:MAG: phosphoadenylyl-sulfate reductase [Bacillaceae bacterium]|nr:phosphoadenylyl-sulfate reductase [Bacillaceae bacterium]